jgi:hypothetical protein
MNARKPITLIALVILPILLFSSFAPAVFADTSATTASPPIAPPNTTIKIASTITMDATPPGTPANTEALIFVAVLKPSGTISGCADAPCEAIFTSGATPGTGSCNSPYGGAVATGSQSTTGGVTGKAGLCIGSDASSWGTIFVTTCTNNPCNGAGDFATLVSYCSGSALAKVITFTPPNTQGDTSQTGTYLAASCWSGGNLNLMTAQTTFVISNSTGVPEFPAPAILIATLGFILIAAMKKGKQPF